jgi:uncharacterized protein (TIGR00299 family) protein
LLDIGTQTGTFNAETLQELAAVLAPEARLSVRRGSSYAIAATEIRVETAGADPAPHRSYRSIKETISQAPDALLSPAAKTQALQVFSRLAHVEAAIHRVDPADVCFHELGAADSLIDIVGVCAGLDALALTELYASPPALGSGTVDCQHGTLPVPAPATAELLKGVPTAMSQAGGELTTPTGAALLGLARGFGPVPPLTPLYLGYGAGSRDIGQPNVCRLMVGAADATAFAPVQRQDTVLLETNLDHITPETVAFAGEELLAEGALDVWVTPIAMKKGRAALLLSVLVKPEEAERFAERVMKLTGTLGLRVSEQPRLIAQREQTVVETPYGPVNLNWGAGRLGPVQADTARIAREGGLDYPDVLATVTAYAKAQYEA